MAATVRGVPALLSPSAASTVVLLLSSRAIAGRSVRLLLLIASAVAAGRLSVASCGCLLPSITAARVAGRLSVASAVSRSCSVPAGRVLLALSGTAVRGLMAVAASTYRLGGVVLIAGGRLVAIAGRRSVMRRRGRNGRTTSAGRAAVATSVTTRACIDKAELKYFTSENVGLDCYPIRGRIG